MSYLGLIELLGKKDLSTEEIVRALPKIYVEPYSRRGSLATREGEYDVVTMAAIDTAKWSAFREGFKKLVYNLTQLGFREYLTTNPSWPKLISDEDGNTDFLELLKRLRFFSDEFGFQLELEQLLSMIGYPETQAANVMQEKVHLSKGSVFALLIDADELISEKKVLKVLKKRWMAMNQDQSLPKNLTYKMQKINSELYFSVSGVAKRDLDLRVWLPGALSVKVQIEGKVEQVFTRDQDYTYNDHFSASSFMLSEAHTQGAPFIHGIGIGFKPLMDKKEVRGTDSITGAVGPAFYLETEWSRRTGWGELILLNRKVEDL